MSPKMKYHRNWNNAETECQKTEKSPKLKCQPNSNVTKTEMSSKLNYHQHSNVTKTNMSSN